MRLSGTAQRLTVIVGDSGRWHHKPLFTENPESPATPDSTDTPDSPEPQG
ncbi:MAG: hypothetical protein QOE58_220 [Actinomycetota bacterium]|jgi:hypothetical protein|nr:hypothetical protein [Actinomycetota bacterium]